MLSILINAYACSPNMGSEPGMAWNWCENLAKYCELHIITEGEFRDKIEKKLPTLPQSKNMYFYYNPVSDKIRKMCWNQGDWRFYYYYDKWQKKTLEIAKEIIRNNHIDIVHQLNMIGFREPGYLWILDKPFIWGPTNAKDTFPIKYLEGASIKKKIFITLKNSITKFQLKYNSKVHNAAKKAKYIIAASGDSAKSIEKYLNRTPVLINESGCELNDNQFIKSFNENKQTLDLLWVGRFIFTKQLELAIRSVAQCNNDNIRLHIVGGTLEEEANYKNLTKSLGIETQCVWYEKVSHERVQKLMQNSDLFFFTSVAEGTPHVILEAFNNNLPVLCFNTCGQGDSVNSSVGIKIELSNPETSIKEFSKILNELENNRDILNGMAQNCKTRQEELSWDRKIHDMIELYNKCLES